jgi:hypothetical protein
MGSDAMKNGLLDLVSFLSSRLSLGFILIRFSGDFSPCLVHYS